VAAPCVTIALVSAALQLFKWLIDVWRSQATSYHGRLFNGICAYDHQGIVIQLWVRGMLSPFVRLPLRSPVSTLACERDYLDDEWTDFNGNWHEGSTEQGAEIFNFWGQEVRGQDKCCFASKEDISTQKNVLWSSYFECFVQIFFHLYTGEQYKLLLVHNINILLVHNIFHQRVKNIVIITHRLLSYNVKFLMSTEYSYAGLTDTAHSVSDRSGLGYSVNFRPPLKNDRSTALRTVHR